MGKHALALLAALDTACINVDELGQAAAELFQQHPDYAIITSFPGLADSTGARLIAEIGDDRSRVRRCSSIEGLRWLCTNHPGVRAINLHHPPPYQEQPAGQCRLDVGLYGGFQYEPAREHYRRRREHGDRHAAATRHLFNKLLGQLHHCLQHRQTFDEAKAFPASPPSAAA